MSDLIPLTTQPSDRNRGGFRGRGRGGGGRRGGYGRGRGGGRRGPGGRRFHSQPRPQHDFKDELEELGARSEDALTIAIQGCCHGQLDAIYDRLRRHEEQPGAKKVDLLLCCGDFQSLRNPADFHSFAVPPKYREMGSFYQYYSGEKKAPVTTLFIGGNHEASQPLQELSYGGWVAPNIYYMGAAGVLNVCGVKIGGISGIYKSFDHTQGRYERPPYDRSTVRSVYHVRNIDVYRMKCLSSSPDIFLSHDWPQGIEQYGNTSELLRQKPFFRDEVARNDLGSPCNRELLATLKPKWWFSAHLHVKFRATVQHLSGTTDAEKERMDKEAVKQLVPSQVKNQSHSKSPEAEASNMAEQTETTTEPKRQETQFHSVESQKCIDSVPDLTDQMTQFLSLDKCLPRRQHLSILHIPAKNTNPNSDKKVQLEYDLEWLAILKKTHNLTETRRRRAHVPGQVTRVSEEELHWVRNKVGNSLIIPENFEQTVRPFQPNRDPPGFVPPPLMQMGNPQTDSLLEMLELDHINTVPFNRNFEVASDDNEIDLDGDEAAEIFKVPHDDNAIDLDDSDENEIDLDGNEIELDDSTKDSEQGQDAKKLRME